MLSHMIIVKINGKSDYTLTGIYIRKIDKRLLIDLSIDR